MGRPLNKKTLALLRPTANVSVSSSELPANILRQRTSTGFLVQTADGENLCTLTADEPQPGQMRLQAFAEDGSTYYVTHIGKELITVQPGTGTQIPAGNEIGWNLDVSTEQSLVLANKTNWKSVNVDGTNAGVWGFNINADKSIYFWSYTNDVYNNAITKLSAAGNVEWSTHILQGDITFGNGFGAICDKNENVYAVNNTDTTTFFVKLNSRGQIVWQKQAETNPLGDARCISAYLDSQKNLYACLYGDNNQSILLQFDINGNLTSQKLFTSPTGYGNAQKGCVLSDDTVIAACSQVQLAGAINGTTEIIRLDRAGNVLTQFAFHNSLNPTGYCTTELVKPDNNSDLICCGAHDNAFIAKFSLAGQLIWQKGYGKTGDTSVRLVDVAVDSNNNSYAVYVGNTSGNPITIITKWNSVGDLIWQRLVTNNDYSLFWNFTITSMQIIDNHIYLEFYGEVGPIYDPQLIIRLNTDNPEVGSFTDPVPYIISDAADSGHGVLPSNLAITTSNITVGDTNFTFTNSNFTQEHITINYEFGF